MRSPETTFNLPDKAPCSWSEELLSLRYPLPKIWTQKSGRPFGIYWSDKLAYGRLWPLPTDDELRAFYDTASYDAYMAGKSDARKTSNSLLSKVAIKLAYLSDRGVVDPTPTIIALSRGTIASVCDLGCGSGLFLEAMRKAGAKTLVGVDPSDKSGASVRARGMEFFHGTAETARAINRRFDVVSMFSSLEHCREAHEAVAGAVSLLDTNGILVIDVPNLQSLGFQTYKQCWYHTDAGRHLHFFTQRSLASLLEICGATPIKWEFCLFVSEFTPGYLASMQEVWDSLYTNELADFPPRPSLFRSMAYLPRAALSPDLYKYQMMRVYARPVIGGKPVNRTVCGE